MISIIPFLAAFYSALKTTHIALEVFMAAFQISGRNGAQILQYRLNLAGI
jgi:hypothetical protein